MIGHARQIVTLSALALVLTACAAQQEPGPVTIVDPVDNAAAEFVSDRRSTAQAFEANGDLAASLVEWRLIAAVKPRDGQAQQEIRRLEALIASRKRALLQQGEDALSKNRRSAARTAFLKVLALDGSDAQAIRRLREIERQSVLANQKTKDDKALAEYRASHSKPQPQQQGGTGDFDQKAAAAFGRGAYREVIDLADQQLKRDPEDSTAASYRQRAYVALAQKSRQSGNLRETLTFLEAASETPAGAQATISKSITAARSDLATSLYTEGLDLMNSDLDRAIELLAEALTYDPTHLQAKQRLDQAQRMRARLQSFN